MFFCLLIAELLKIKSTIAFWIMLIFPLITSILYFFIFYFNGEYFLKELVSPWLKLFAYTLGFWSVFILPLFITLQTSLINEIESRISAWKQLLTIGKYRQVIFTSKLLVVFFIVFISILFLIIFTFTSGILLCTLRPDLGFSNYPIPISLVFSLILHLFICSLPIVVIHFFFSILFNKLFASLTIGISITVLNIIITNTNMAIYFPWSYSALIVGDKLSENIPGLLNYEISGIVLSVIICFTSISYFTRKDYI